MLIPPPRSFSKTPLLVSQVNPIDLLRVSGYSSGEPYFGRAASNRFDDYRPPKSKRFGTCYFGLTLSVAFAETVLHDEFPVGGHFAVPPEKLESRYVVRFSGTNLTLADLTGAALKRSGAASSISSIAPYGLPQRWSVAIHRHPQAVDGILYMSRHMNSEKAVVLFDRVMPKVSPARYVPLLDYPGALRAAVMLGVTGA